jgi:beta-glucosidase
MSRHENTNDMPMMKRLARSSSLVPRLTIERRGLLGAAAGLLASAKFMRFARPAANDGSFPAGFVWGASTSSYQIEGAVDADGRGKSIWDVFSHTPGRVKNGDTGDTACDHYHRWRDDIDLVSDANFSAYRFSTAWPRIVPAGDGAVESRGLDFYDSLVDRLAAKGITPWICLYHWDLPQALQEKGGWLSRDTSAKFADYAAVVARRLGDRVRHWAVMNEPNVHALFGHGVGEHAPGLTGLPAMFAAIHNLNLAQGRAVQALRAERGDFRVGTVISLQPARPVSDSAKDRRAVARFDAMWNGACLDPLMKGAYPAAIESELAPFVIDGDFAAMRQRIDYIGVNYYSPMYIADAPEKLLGAWFGAAPAGTQFTAMNWPIDAEGLTQELIGLRDKYGDLELYVTENGACYEDARAADGVVHDDDRIAYLRAHVAAMSRALAAGVNLRGYFVWSLLDNFEWAEGYTRRFGLVHVDFESLRRTPKASYRWLAEFIADQRRKN